MRKKCLQQEEAPDACSHFSCRATWVVRLLIIAVLAGSAVWAYAATPPANFPQGRKVEVPHGAALRTISDEFKDDGLIRSSLFFEGVVRAFGNDTSVQAGTYFFEEALPLFDLVKRLTQGIFGLTPTRVTIPEGATVKEVSYLLKRRFPDFDVDQFLELASDKEGYLFPDTYFFLEGTPPEQVVAEMTSNFEKRIAPYATQIASSTLTLDQIITFASLLEKEAKKPEERRMIAGILNNRLAINMPLQVDATFRYTLGKGSFQLTKKDLRNDSPYNTYVNKGLPPGPIANPGLDAIAAVLEPTPSKYMYYLHDMNGKARYAVTFAQHKKNKYTYLP